MINQLHIFPWGDSRGANNVSLLGKDRIPPAWKGIKTSQTLSPASKRQKTSWLSRVNFLAQRLRRITTLIQQKLQFSCTNLTSDPLKPARWSAVLLSLWQVNLPWLMHLFHCPPVNLFRGKPWFFFFFILYSEVKNTRRTQDKGEGWAFLIIPFSFVFIQHFPSSVLPQCNLFWVSVFFLWDWISFPLESFQLFSRITWLNVLFCRRLGVSDFKDSWGVLMMMLWFQSDSAIHPIPDLLLHSI